MSIAAGTEAYTLGGSPVEGRGITWTADELNSALADPIADLVLDTEGTAEITDMFEGLADTDFDPTNVKRIFSATETPEYWRVGEALGEAYLAEYCYCFFPWPDGRDERIPGASLPGADLVGFEKHGDENRFAFGEVKTSYEDRHPPGVMYGRHGLKEQLEFLRDKDHTRDKLVKYLGHRAVNSSWQPRFIEASKRYLANDTDVRLFGFLVREEPTDVKDLRSRVTKLTTDCPPAMRIQLHALYIPSGRVANLGSDVMRTREGGDT